ncbi:hypothetical protein PUN28_011809 [Cardiocondyla obscurior]|uniref:Uncharacterized protein n=1 Tax=Cardiocondyla obscurior TaxID=286306 RepID=A0AAW2FK72_9HYME
MTIIFARAYEIKKDVASFNENAKFHLKSRSRNFSLNQPFVDKTISLQTLVVISQRDRTVSQRAFPDVSLKDRVPYSFGFPISRHQPFKEDPFTVTSFRDKPLFKDAILKNRQIREERAVLRDNPFDGQSFTSEEIFEPRAYRNQAPFKEQLFADGTSLKNLLREPSPSAKQQTLFQKLPTLIEPSSVSNLINFYQDDYIKHIDSYKYKNQLPLFDGKFTEYGNIQLILFSKLSNLTCTNCFAGNLILNFLLKYKAVYLLGDLTAGIPNNLISNTFDGIFGSITDGISTSIPGSMTTNIPESIPTLNLGQNVRQLIYYTGLQAQLRGLGGINYTLHTGNPATRPIEYGIAKAGLTPTKLPQLHIPSLTKVSSQVAIVNSKVHTAHSWFLLLLCVVFLVSSFATFSLFFFSFFLSHNFLPPRCTSRQRGCRIETLYIPTSKSSKLQFLPDIFYSLFEIKWPHLLECGRWVSIKRKKLPPSFRVRH